MGWPSQWRDEKNDPAPFETPCLVFDGETIAVGRKTQYPHRASMWWIDESFGYNEDGEISGVLFWTELPPKPEPFSP